jgi:hypothetical protein
MWCRYELVNANSISPNGSREHMRRSGAASERRSLEDVHMHTMQCSRYKHEMQIDVDLWLGLWYANKAFKVVPLYFT